MEKMTQDNEEEVFSSQEKAEILAQAKEGASSMEEVMDNVNKITEERFNNKKSASEEQRIAELKAEIQTPVQPVENAANVQEKAVSADSILEEAQDLVKKEVPWYKRMLRKDASYKETGNQVYTKAGNKVDIVTGPDEKEYVKLTEHRGGGGDAGHQSTKYYYIPLEKAQPFLKKF